MAAAAEVWRLEVSLVGADSFVDRRLGKIKAGLDDWSPVWPQVAAWFYAMQEEQFASAGRGRWTPLAPATRASRAQRGFPPAAPILIETGRLFASLMGGADHIRKETKTSITLGTDLQVGAWNLGWLHEEGTGRMPPRPPIGRSAKKGGQIMIDPGDAKLLRVIFGEYLHALVTGEGV